MSILTRVVVSFALLTTGATAAAQTPLHTKEQGGITGQITIAGKGVPHAVVLLYRSGELSGLAMTKTSTDLDGRYTFNNIAPGQYNVLPVAHAYVYSPGQGSPDRGRVVTVGEARIEENVDFSLVRGGVVTGRVMDARGKPIIGEQVHVMKAGERAYEDSRPYALLTTYTTDDRGIFRVFGLPAGKYVVAVGRDSEGAQRSINIGAAYYRRTYHPDAAERVKAKIVEVSEAVEATGVDITVGPPAKKYTASGRIIDVATGKPAPNLMISHATVSKEGNNAVRLDTGYQSDARGNFRIERLVPGRYSAYVKGGEKNEYADPIQFEISDKDVSGLELKVKRGATLNGLVVVIGTDAPHANAELARLQIHAYLRGDAAFLPNQFSRVNVDQDGSFHLVGLTPGKLQVNLEPTESAKNFSLLQVERDGVPQGEGITISPEDRTVNVKVVVGYGSGTVRGQAKVENGQLPEGAQLWATIHQPGNSTWIQRRQVDERGQFIFEVLPSGEYDVFLRVTMPEANTLIIYPVKEKVFVTSGSQSQVTLTLNLTRDR